MGTALKQLHAPLKVKPFAHSWIQKSTQVSRTLDLKMENHIKKRREMEKTRGSIKIWKTSFRREVVTGATHPRRVPDW